MALHLLRRSLALCGLMTLALHSATAQDSLDDDFTLQEAAYLAQHAAHPAIRWAPCAQAPSQECGTLAVPIEHRRPHNGSFDMALVRIKASSPARRLGVLALTHGGPTCASAVDATLAFLSQPHYGRLRERFDLVSFDARGTGRSRPVQCDVVPAGQPPAQASHEALMKFFDDFGRGLAETCLKQNGPFLTTVSTNNVARDLDVLRRALGILQTPRIEALTAVSCLDCGSRRSAASSLPYGEAFAALNRRLSQRFDVAALTAMCSAWPAVDAPIITRIQGRVPNPVLPIGSHFDDRTPLTWARSMARTLGMERSLIRYEGGTHSVDLTRPGSARIACIDQAVEGYLFDLRVPPEGFACAARPVVF
jgi:pimeloyl-ACP methyl ester carboxylesterase